MGDYEIVDFWKNECNLDLDDIKKGGFNSNNNQALNIKDIDSRDGFRDIVIYHYHGTYAKSEDYSDFDYDFLTSLLAENEKTENELEIYVSFNSWEHERDVISKLKMNVDSAPKKNIIESNFALFSTRYIGESKNVSLILEDGINYLDSPKSNSGFGDTLEGIVVNCSLFELKKLYNAVGDGLFRSNVREGIRDNKSQLRSIFRNYLLNKQPAENDVTTSLEGEQEVNAYDSDIFWYSHNGITVYVDKSKDDNLSFEGNRLTLNKKACSVINGAQTIFNLFLVYDDLKQEYKISKDDTEDEKKEKNKLQSDLEAKMKSTYVKLTIINGNPELSKYITRGLNTQMPITIEDFVAISQKVLDINEVAKRYVYILKTGEVKRENGVTPLKFIKYYLAATSRPGQSKNYNKSDIEKTIDEIHSKLVINEDDGNKTLSVHGKIVLEKMKVIPIIETWWRGNKKRIERKTAFDRFGLTYFQSYVLENLRSDELEDISNERLSEIYDEIKEIIEDVKGDQEASDYKNDVLFSVIVDRNVEIFKINTLIKKYINKINLGKVDNDDGIINALDQEKGEKVSKGKDAEKIKVCSCRMVGEEKRLRDCQSTKCTLESDMRDYETNLLAYLAERRFHKNNFKHSIKEGIKNYNKEIDKEIEDFRTILVDKNKVNVGFHLSLKSFSSIYGDIDILEILKDNDKFEEAFKNIPRYEDSVLKTCLSQKYNLYFVFIEGTEDTEIINIRYFEKHSFQFDSDDEAVFEKIYDLTIEAFRKGEWAMIPKSNMKNIIYVAPKARNGSDTFYFTDGEEHVKQTFWIHKNLIEKQIKKLIG